MKKLLAVLLVVLAASATLATPALAGASTDAALALGAFAVFNQLATGHTVFQRSFVPPPPPVVYAPRPRVYVPAPGVRVYPRTYRYVIPGYYYPRAYSWGPGAHRGHGRGHERGRDHFRGHEGHRRHGR